MKVIDILNKVANGEEVEFKFLNSDDVNSDEIFEVENGHLRNSTCGIFLDTQIDHYNWENIGYGFLNQEVEIIEEDKKIEYLYLRSHNGGTFEEEQAFRNRRDDEITTKINKIIDYINREK